METISFLYTSIVWFSAGFLNGVTAFGGNLLGTPLMTIIMGTKESIVLGCLAGVAMTLTIAVIYHHSLPLSEFFIVTFLSISTSFVGGKILIFASSRILLFTTSAILIIFLLWQYISNKIHTQYRLSIIIIIPIGIVHGLLQGSIGMAGPVLAIYALLRKWSKEMALATLNMVAFFSLTTVAVNQYINGFYTQKIVSLAPYAILSTVTGSLLSVYAVRHIKSSIFKKLMLIMIAMSSAMLLVRGISI